MTKSRPKNLTFYFFLQISLSVQTSAAAVRRTSQFKNKYSETELLSYSFKKKSIFQQNHTEDDIKLVRNCENDMY